MWLLRQPSRVPEVQVVVKDYIEEIDNGSAVT
jgi:hypothetical protein